MSLFLCRLLAIGIILGILGLLEWAFGLGRFLVFFFITSLIWIVPPVWLRRKIYIDREPPSWLRFCFYGLIILWLSAQWWFIVHAPLSLTPQQRGRAEFIGFLFTLPSTIYTLLVFYVLPLLIAVAVCVALIMTSLKAIGKMFRRNT